MSFIYRPNTYRGPCIVGKCKCGNDTTLIKAEGKPTGVPVYICSPCAYNGRIKTTPAYKEHYGG